MADATGTPTRLVVKNIPPKGNPPAPPAAPSVDPLVQGLNTVPPDHPTLNNPNVRQAIAQATPDVPFHKSHPYAFLALSLIPGFGQSYARATQINQANQERQAEIADRRSMYDAQVANQQKATADRLAELKSQDQFRRGMSATNAASRNAYYKSQLDLAKARAGRGMGGKSDPKTQAFNSYVKVTDLLNKMVQEEKANVLETPEDVQRNLSSNGTYTQLLALQKYYLNQISGSPSASGPPVAPSGIPAANTSEGLVPDRVYVPGSNPPTFRPYKPPAAASGIGS